jgi:hypothetical protein
MALGLTQPVTAMSTTNPHMGKARPAREADNLTTIHEPIVLCGILAVSQPSISPWAITELTLLFLLFTSELRLKGAVPRGLNHHTMRT